MFLQQSFPNVGHSGAVLCIGIFSQLCYLGLWTPGLNLSNIQSKSSFFFLNSLFINSAIKAVGKCTVYLFVLCVTESSVLLCVLVELGSSEARELLCPGGAPSHQYICTSTLTHKGFFFFFLSLKENTQRTASLVVEKEVGLRTRSDRVPGM